MGITRRTVTLVLVTCVLLVAGVGWVAWGRADRSSGPVHPTGTVPAADRSTIRGRITYSTLAADIWVMNANGTARRRLTRSGRGYDFDPSWSPRARAIVFRTSRGHYVRDPNGSGAEGLFVVDARTKHQREIEPRTGGLFPDWSPDGALIAFSGLRRGPFGDSVHVMTPRGTRVRDLGGGGAQECAEWSPDGRRIAYCGHNGDGNWAIWVMNRDGSNKRQLTHPVPSGPPGSGGNALGAWSPDGRQIVYSDWQGDFDLFLMSSDGTDRRRLTDWPGGDSVSAWLPSGQIVFAHFTGDQRLPRWYLINPDGSGLRSLPWLYGAGDPLDWIQLR